MRDRGATGGGGTVSDSILGEGRSPCSAVPSKCHNLAKTARYSECSCHSNPIPQRKTFAKILCYPINFRKSSNILIDYHE